MIKQVRVRFAPSPTGHLHIGGLRTALFNMLFARHHQGTFLVRIEDTDRVRSLPEYTTSIMESLAWCSLLPDEDIIFQSDRLAEYKKIAFNLVQNGHAYHCYCTPSELQLRLGKNAAAGEGYVMYDGWCREKQKTTRNDPFVIRFKTNKNRSDIKVTDLIRGTIHFPMTTIDDFVIMRSDGYPTYNLSAVVDDASMHISHVIRGEEHLVNTPRQILLYEACGYEYPQFAHLPLILGKDGTKLSKRDAAVSVIDYKRVGFLSVALCNYLVRLGWSYGDQEIFSREDMIKLFSLERVGKSGAIFDGKKLEWMNSIYIEKLSTDQLLLIMDQDVCTGIDKLVASLSVERKNLLIDIYKKRFKTLLPLCETIFALLNTPSKSLYAPYIAKISEIQWQSLDLFIQRLSKFEYNRSVIEKLVQDVTHDTEIPFSLFSQMIRIALTGSSAAPGIYDLLVLLGKDEVIKRLQQLLQMRQQY